MKPGTGDILAARPAKHSVDPFRPYAFLVEPECSADGQVENVATVFLTNRECPFRCLMCDLWKNTTDKRVPNGAIPEQIDFALSRLPPAKHIKLYNSGSFFDRQAIPGKDYGPIADRLEQFETVIVENHPKFIGDDCFRFRDFIAGELEIAIGLETIHPQVLSRLNKQMTVDDFEQAVYRLTRERIPARAFILLRPPFLDDAEGASWAIQSMQFAFAIGVRCCSVIPTRGGNGIMEQLQSAGQFSPPSMSSLEKVFSEGLAMHKGRVFVDLWDIEKLFSCQRCGPARRARLHQMNLTQRLTPPVVCDCQSPS